MIEKTINPSQYSNQSLNPATKMAQQMAVYRQAQEAALSRDQGDFDHDPRPGYFSFLDEAAGPDFYSKGPWCATFKGPDVHLTSNLDGNQPDELCWEVDFRDADQSTTVKTYRRAEAQTGELKDTGETHLSYPLDPGTSVSESLQQMIYGVVHQSLSREVGDNTPRDQDPRPGHFQTDVVLAGNSSAQDVHVVLKPDLAQGRFRSNSSQLDWAFEVRRGHSGEADLETQNFSATTTRDDGLQQLVSFEPQANRCTVTLTLVDELALFRTLSP